MKILILLLLISINIPFVIAGPPELNSKEKFQKDSQEICAKEWTKRGELDQRMFDYCFKNQLEAYENLKQLHQYANQSFYADDSYPYCLNKWTKRGVSNAQMMVYCLNREIEGIKDIMYYRKQYDENKVNQIAGRALQDYKSWSMAAYKVKQHFER